MNKFNNVDEYIDGFDTRTKLILIKIRKLINKVVPSVKELISYQMPAYKYKGKVLIYFAGYKNHIGLYATPRAHIAFEKELSQYVQGKGSVQFPLDSKIPYDLINQIVIYNKNQIDKLEKN